MEQHLIADIPVKALVERDGKVLIVLDYKWELPGGRMNVGETPEEALHREIREELQVDIKVGSIYNAFTFTSERSGQTHFIVVYRCDFVGDTPIQLDGKEVQEVRWISAEDDLSSIPFFPGYQKMLEEFLQK